MAIIDTFVLSLADEQINMRTDLWKNGVVNALKLKENSGTVADMKRISSADNSIQWGTNSAYINQNAYVDKYSYSGVDVVCDDRQAILDFRRLSIECECVETPDYTLNEARSTDNSIYMIIDGEVITDSMPADANLPTTWKANFQFTSIVYIGDQNSQKTKKALEKLEFFGSLEVGIYQVDESKELKTSNIVRQSKGVQVYRTEQKKTQIF